MTFYFEYQEHRDSDEYKFSLYYSRWTFAIAIGVHATINHKELECNFSNRLVLVRFSLSLLLSFLVCVIYTKMRNFQIHTQYCVLRNYRV